MQDRRRPADLVCHQQQGLAVGAVPGGYKSQSLRPQVAGGPAFLKAVAAVYRSVGFVPTGGISAANLGTYLVLPNVLACGGSWMVRRDLLSAGAFDQVEAQVWDAVRLVASLDAEGAIR